MVTLEGRLKSITENLLNENDFLVLFMPVQKSEVAVKAKDRTQTDFLAYFLKVVRANPYFARISIGNLNDNTTTGPSILHNDGLAGSEKQLFQTSEKNPHSLYHIGVKLNSTDKDVKFGVENPANFIVTGLRTKRQPNDKLTDKFGWYPANRLTYEATPNDVLPTILTEQMILPNVQPRYAIRNESGAQITGLEIEVIGKTYRLVHITDQEAQKALLEKNTKNNVHFKTYGAFRDFQRYIPEEWPEPVEVNDNDYQKVVFS